jgi:O-antigen/teichoic acid export membrane protein
MSIKLNIIKNTALLLAADIGSKIVGLVYIIILARYLGAEGFGTISSAQAYSGLFVVLTDLGLQQLTVREIARDKSNSSKYVNNVLGVRLVLTILILIPFAIIIYKSYYADMAHNALYVILLSYIILSFSNIFDALFQAYEEMKYIAIKRFLNSILMLLAIIFMTYGQLGIIGIAFAYLIVSALVLVFDLAISSKYFVYPSVELNLNFWKNIIKQAIPFGLTGIFFTTYFQVDTIMLSMLKGNEVVGWYNAAFKFITMLFAIPVITSLAIFPASSKSYTTSKESLKDIIDYYFKIMLILGIPLAVGTTLLSEKIILLFYDYSYNNSIIILQILMWGLAFIFIYVPFFRLFESANRQIVVTKIAFISCVINIILNFSSIPQLSYIGASLATLITQIIVFIICYLGAHKMGFGFPHKENFILVIKIVIANIIMATFITVFREFNLIFIILVCMFIYFFILYILKGIDKGDIDLLFGFSKLLRKLKNSDNVLIEKLMNFCIRLFDEPAYKITQELSSYNSILDIACGKNSPLRYLNLAYTVGIDLYKPYLKESKEKMIHSDYIICDIRKIEFKPKSFEAVIAWDVLEHLKKEEGFELLKKMDSWAIKKILIYTPNGYIKQSEYDDNPLQEHVSGWTKEELEYMGYKVIGVNGLKNLRTERSVIKYRPQIFWKFISVLTQFLLHRYPEYAFQLVAIKTKGGV